MLVVAAALCQEGNVLISQRRAAKPGGCLWELPGGNVEPGEHPEEVLRLELEEELGVVVSDARPVTIATDTQGQIVLLLFVTTAWDGEPAGKEGQTIKWVPLTELGQQRMLTLDEELMTPLRASMS